MAHAIVDGQHLGLAVLGTIVGNLEQETESPRKTATKITKRLNIRDVTLISQRAYGLSSIMKSSVLTAVLLRDGTEQSSALELRKVAFVLCFSPGTQTPFMNCGGRSERNALQRIGSQPDFGLAFPHLQSGGVAAEVGGVDEAEAEHSCVATVEGPDVAQSTVLQICYLHWLTCQRSDNGWFTSLL